MAEACDSVIEEAAHEDGALRCVDDVDAWGALAEIFAAHPAWEDVSCERLIRAWAEQRVKTEQHAERVAEWRRTWADAHRVEFARASARRWPRAWAERSRFAQLWSYGRYPVPPFQAVAELMLARCAQPQEPPLAASRPRADFQGAVLVVAPQADLESFSVDGASKQLLWALREGGFNWTLFHPREHWDERDLEAVTGVIFWSYGALVDDYLCHAASLERVCRARGIPIANSVLAGWDTRHSATLRKWQRAGVRCARFQKFAALDDIELAYPLILRADGVHAGRGMYFVQDRSQAEAVMQKAREDYLACAYGKVAPPDLAIEFVDVRGEDGLYNKRRAYVAGEAMIRRHHVVSQHWLVNQESSLATAGTRHLEEPDGEAEVEAVLRAGRATGSEVAALDYARCRDGGYVFWESNRFFSMVGDRGYSTLARARQPAKKRGRRDRALGRAIQLLLHERFGHPGRVHHANAVQIGP
ncbi:MAG TPA: hypothetical protein VI299_01295 [Polyangiales bacterium]